MAGIDDRSRISVSPFGGPTELNCAESRAMNREVIMADVDDRSRLSVSPFGDAAAFNAEPRPMTASLTMVDNDTDMVDSSQSLSTSNAIHLNESSEVSNNSTGRPETFIDLTKSSRTVIDLTSDDETERAIDELTSDIAHVTASFTHDASNFYGFGSAYLNILQPINGSSTPEPKKPQYLVSGIAYRAGMSLELDDGSFMRVTDVVPESHNLRFFGRRLYRTTHPEAKTYLPKVHNELVWLTQDTDNVSIKKVKRVVQIIFTNFRTDFINIPPEQRGKLICRLKLTIRQNGVIIIPGQVPLTAEQCAVEWLTFDESDLGYALPSKQLRDQWRGRTVYFGDAAMSSKDEDARAENRERQGVIDLTEPKRAYTFGDAYCGGGGMSCGAKQAGLKIKWAVDMDKHALETYQLNFNNVEVEHSDFFSFLTNDANFLRVDIAHCSPPCQTWSPAHTVPCPRDDANSACVFSAGSLIRESRPRILTLEETMGLPQRFPIIFNRVVLDMVEFGYSVRWAVLGCDDYGVPQERKRLVLIAAGPGEFLPNFPQPTHGLPGHGLLPRETISSTIDNIPPDADDHDVDRALERWALSHRTPFDRFGLARTITCGGGEFNYHPSGTRPYTSREMALLQTFPLDYQFAGKFMRKQIGNAVPPLFAKAIFVAIIAALTETDEEESTGFFT
ncbi:hypothetical protein N7457_006567 [Penicillium paradoxum]|uniref:uncharacterized protein n=1 Tax=Penicillium paradoxum TaxID=176176 RepID=UPI002547727B|nr:uncharacterized protein N7457_006567 [Penicillium paradoxum]KAJ5778847.1 hypothetical protein N7457_006567 [Penicillium paradoxum]